MAEVVFEISYFNWSDENSNSVICLSNPKIISLSNIGYRSIVLVWVSCLINQFSKLLSGFKSSRSNISISTKSCLKIENSSYGLLYWYINQNIALNTVSISV